MRENHRYRSLVINVVLIVVAFALLGLAIYRHSNQIKEVFSRKIELQYFVLGCGIYLAGLVLTFCRWCWLVRVSEPAFRIRDAVLLGFIGNVYNLVIPFAVGGDLIKAAFLMRMQIKRTQAIASMVIDRILGLLGLFLVAGVAGLVAWPSAGLEVRRLIVVVWIALATGVLGLLAVFNEALPRHFPNLLRSHGRLALIASELKAMAESYRGRLNVVAGAILLSCLWHVMSVTAFYAVSKSLFPVRMPTFRQHCLVVPLILFTTAVPLPFGALGVSEEVSQQLFNLVNHPEGFMGMLAFRVLIYSCGLVSAVCYLISLNEIRALTGAEHRG
jgi:hypothetical protein